MNTPTDEQVEAALNAWVGGSFREMYPESIPYWEPKMRRALAAAAGAAPRELTDKGSEALKAAAKPYAHRFQRGKNLGLYVQIRHLPGIVAEWLRGDAS